MPPENLPINETHSEGDWWVFNKISQNKSLQELTNNRFFKPSKGDKWWNFSLSTKTILFFVVISLFVVYQNKSTIADTFPNTFAALNSINVVPELLTKVSVNLESRYSLSSILVSLENNKPLDPTPIVYPVVNPVMDQDTSLEKPIKIIIDKISVNSPVTNPISKDLDTLNKSLKLGAVRYPSSGSLDEDKSIFIFGHSTSLPTEHTYYKTFNNLNKLVIGNEIILQSADNNYTYKVTSVNITNTEDALIEFSNDKKLIISTCNTLGQKEERIIVKADFIKSSPIVPVIGENIVSPYPIINPEPGTETNTIYEIPTDPTVIEDPSDRIDFLATVDAIGIMDENNQFVATSTTQVKNKIIVKFTVKNIGNKKSNSWYFNAVLPTSPFHIFHSKSQQALAPGEKIEFTMGFDRPKVGDNQLVIVNVDPAGGIKESNKDNNIAKEFVTIVE